MNGNQFPPNDNGAGKLHKSKVIFRFLLIANQQLTKALHERMRHFHNPASGFEIGIAFQLFLFLSARSDMNRIAPLF